MRTLKRVATSLRDSTLDLMVLTGLVLVAVGLGMYSMPLLPITLGAGILIAVALAGRT